MIKSIIEFLKENYSWIGAILIPIIVAIIGAWAVIANKNGRTQKIRDIRGDGNNVINGDVNNHGGFNSE